MSALVASPRRRQNPAPARLAPGMRATIEAAIERLIALLDTLDGDPDLEDGADAELDDEADELDRGEHDEAELAERHDYGTYP